MTVKLGEQRTSVTIELSGERFTITRVVVGVHRAYGEYLDRAGELLKRLSKYEEGEESEKLVDEVEGFYQRKYEMLYYCIRLLLEKNGYEFDRNWWEENAEQQDLEEFVVEAMKKDGTGKKKATAG
jgi:hypothetical protein